MRRGFFSNLLNPNVAHRRSSAGGDATKAEFVDHAVEISNATDDAQDEDGHHAVRPEPRVRHGEPVRHEPQPARRAHRMADEHEQPEHL